MIHIGDIPVFKRLYPSLLKRWASLTWPHGYKIKKHQGILFLLNWQNHIDRKVGLRGGHERDQVSFLLSQMTGRCDAFLDIGANFGLYALQVVKTGYASAIHAFEPDPRNYAQMQGNLYLNKMTGTIKTHQLAVSDRAGMLEFDLYPETSTGQTRVSQSGTKGTALRTVTLDEMFDWQGKTLFLKIDIEGHEIAAINGAKNLLRKNNCFLQVELFPENVNNVTTTLNASGYEKIHQIEYDYYFKKAKIKKEKSRHQTTVNTIDKNIIMCLTTGRSGTNLLEKLLSLANDINALHEPEPSFQSVLENVRHDPSAAINFVRDSKLPSILANSETNYAETSHLFGKGFFEAFIALDIPFRLIILNRDPREVSKSLWRIKAIPSRTKHGREFLFDPTQNGVLKLNNWEKMSDYQLCYWYCLEVERRKTIYAAECRERGIPIIEISMLQLKDWSKFQQLCKICGLTLPDTAKTQHAEICTNKVNRKSKHHTKYSLIPFAWQEQKVWQALGKDGVVLHAEVEARYKIRQNLIV